MRPVLLLVALLAACHGGKPPVHGRSAGPGPAVGELAADDAFRPSYGAADLEKALIAERGAEATAERRVSELEAGSDGDALRVARADLEVRRRFIATVEACQHAGRSCPPRLDDPPWTFDLDGDKDPKLDTPLRFDREDWQRVTAELHGRACACRTLACVDSVGVAIDRLEPRPMAEVQGDEAATISITRARECLFRLRGKRAPATAAKED